jgi:hypothetical protein
VYPTATVATLIFLGVAAIVLWGDRPAPFELRPWQLCGVVVLALYAVACALTGEVYRPRPGGERGAAFYLLSLMPFVPVVTLVFARWRAHSSR